MKRSSLLALLLSLALLLGQGGPGEPGGQGESEHLPVYIEDSPAAMELVEEARDLRSQGRLTDAVAAWQRVMDEFVGKLVPVSERLYIEVARWARRQVAGDAELLAIYRQVHGPEAERAAREAAQTPLDPAPLAAILRRHYLTAAGLDAGLDLAALYLERADAAAAEGVLAELADHPDLAAHRARFHQLGAVGAALADDDEGLATHEGALRDLGAAEALTAVARWVDELDPPKRGARLDDAAADAAPPPLDRPLWQLPLADEDPPARQGYPGGHQVPALPTLPVVHDDRLYLNETTRLSAIDRFSGRRLWTFEAAGSSVVASPMMARMGRSLDDRRGALVLGDRVLAVMGQATNWPGRVGPDDRGTALVAVDRETGRQLWRVTPQELDESLQRSYFQGTPLATYDRVFVLVRRNQASGFQDAFVLAVDAATGELLWRRHVSSAVTASRFATGAPPQMTLAGGTLFVGDSLAAVAAIDTRNGAVAWTRVLVEPGDAGARGINVRGDENDLDAAPPVLLAAGLLVPPLTSGQDMVVLDPETGDERRTVPAGPGGGAEYLIPTGEDVLAVGRHVTLLDGETLETKWTMPAAPSSPTGVRGMATVAGDLAIIPTPDRLLLLSLIDGHEVAQLELTSGANAAAVDGQIVLTDAGSVKSYLPWARAYEALATQIEAEPENPRPGLAMAHLAASMGETDAVAEGTHAALAALERAAATRPAAEVEPLQRDVFTQLLAFGRAASGIDASLREEMLASAATVSTGPEQEVAYHLALGALLEELNRPVEAVEHYQAVLMSALLSSQLYTRDDTSRQAGLEAQRRLTDLVQRHGREVYQPFEQEAARQLAELVARGVDPQALAELAAKYPLADAAPRALLAAGRLLAEQGRPADAVAPLRRAYVRATDPVTLAEAAGRLAEVYEQQGRPRLAVQWLRRVSREHPDLHPLRDGVAVSSDTWIGELAAMRGTSGAAPSLQLPIGGPRTVAGSLLPPRRRGDGTGPSHRFLVRRGDTLRMHTLPGPATAWEAALPAEDAEVLAMDHEQTLLWSNAAETLWSLDTATGAPAYAPVEARKAFAPLGDAAERQAHRPDAEQRFLEMIDVGGPVQVVNGRVEVARPARPEGYLVDVGESVVVLADRGGGVVGIDRHTGRTLWHHAARIEQVAAVEVGDDVVVLVGVRNLGTEALGGAVQVLDLLSGEPRLPLLEDKDTPQWARVVTAGGVAALAVATADHLTAHRLADGVVLWRLAIPGEPLTGRGWASQDLLLIETNGGTLLAVDPAAGEVTHRVELGPAGRGGLRDIALVEGQWHLCGAGRAIALGADGATVWQDAVETMGDHVVGQWISDAYVLLLSAAESDMQRRQAQIFVQPDLDGPRVVMVQPDGGDEIGTYNVFALNRLTGAIDREFRLSLASPERLTPAMLLDNHALLQGQGRVVILPGGPAPAAAAPR